MDRIKKTVAEADHFYYSCSFGRWLQVPLRSSDADSFFMETAVTFGRFTVNFDSLIGRSCFWFKDPFFFIAALVANFFANFCIASSE